MFCFGGTHVLESFHPTGPPPLHKSNFPTTSKPESAHSIGETRYVEVCSYFCAWDLYRDTAGLSGGLVLSRLAANRWLPSPSHERGHLAAFPLRWRDYCPPQTPSSFQLSQGASTSPRDPLYKRKTGIHIALRVSQHLEVALPIGAILNPNNYKMNQLFSNVSRFFRSLPFRILHVPGLRHNEQTRKRARKSHRHY